MKYLFFDLECANCKDRKGKIYSFGYVLADENLNEITKAKDIIINPNVDKWDWYVVKNILAYPKAEVESRAKFSKHYPKIKELMEDEGTIVCGFDVRNDVGYILDECERYSLEPISMNFLDIQKIETKLSTGKNKSLSEAYIRWLSKLPEGTHRSDVDAQLTLELARAMCKAQGKTLAEFMQEDETLYGKTEGFRFGFNKEPLETKEEREKRKWEERLLRFAEKNGKVRDKNGDFKEQKEEFKDYILKGSKNNLLFLRLLDSVTPKTEREQTLAGKTVSISLNYEAYNFTNMMKLVQIICDCGGTYVKKASTADIFVRYHLEENGEERRCAKYEFVKEEIANGKDIKVIEFDELLQLLGITEEQLNEIPPEDYEYLMDDKYKKIK